MRPDQVGSGPLADFGLFERGGGSVIVLSRIGMSALLIISDHGWNHWPAKDMRWGNNAYVGGSNAMSSKVVTKNSPQQIQTLYRP